jgi:hypothetical protein
MSRKNPYSVGRRVVWQVPKGPARLGTIKKIIDETHVLVAYDNSRFEFSVNTSSPYLRHLNDLDKLADASP